MISNSPPVAEILMVEDSATDAELALRMFQRARVANPLTVLSSCEQASPFCSAPALTRSADRRDRC